MDLGLSRARSGALLAVAGGLLLGALTSTHGHPDPEDGFAAALVAVAGWALVAASAWLTAATLALFVEACSSGLRTAPGWCTAPSLLRRLAVVSTGAALSAGLAAPVMAAPAPAPPPAVSPSALDGLSLPVRPAGGPADTRPSRPEATSHVVGTGGTLWALARRLAPDASDADLVRSVRAIHAANRGVIGDDPDRLLPGQRLHIPGSLR